MATIPVSDLEYLLQPVEVLNRCDRCGARGKFLVVFTSGLDLIFCAHHAHEYAGTVHGIDQVLNMDPPSEI